MRTPLFAFGIGVCGLGLAALPPPARADGAKCPQIQIVMDRTGSMTQTLASGEQKWAVISKAVKDFTSKYSKSIRFGFTYYNGNGCKMPVQTDPCSPGCKMFEPKDDAAAEIATIITGLKPSGTTSTWETMALVKDYAFHKDTMYDNYVLLITDGLPNCTEERDMSGMIKGGYTGAKSIAAIKAIGDAGTPVFVMGVGTMAGDLALNTDILDKMAEAGGLPQPPPSKFKFIAADNPAEAAAAFDAIAGKAGGGTIGGCFGGPGMGGAGGGGAGGGGAGGGGAGGGGQGGFAGSGGSSGADHGSPGCTCSLGGRAAGLGGGLVLLAAMMGSLAARRRRR